MSLVSLDSCPCAAPEKWALIKVVNKVAPTVDAATYTLFQSLQGSGFLM
jgi:hypothetical protein